MALFLDNLSVKRCDEISSGLVREREMLLLRRSISSFLPKIPKTQEKYSLSDQEEEEDKNVTRSRDFGGHAHSGDGEWSVQGEKGASG